MLYYVNKHGKCDVSEKDIVNRYLNYAEYCVKGGMTAISAVIVYLFLNFDTLSTLQFIIVVLFVVVVFATLIVAVFL